MNLIAEKKLVPKSPWRKESQAQFGGVLASLYRRSENVIIEAIIVPEPELRNVKMKVFFGDVVECADDAALEDAPEAFNRFRANHTDQVLWMGMIDDGIPGRTGSGQAIVARAVRRKGTVVARVVENGHSSNT